MAQRDVLAPAVLQSRTELVSRGEGRRQCRACVCSAGLSRALSTGGSEGGECWRKNEHGRTFLIRPTN